MPYGDLAAQRVQRFASREDLARHQTTIEEREEYEPHLEAGRVVFAGVDYEAILRAGRARGRRHPLGRRQQRPALLSAGPPHRRGRPAACRRRAPLPPRRGQPAHGRRGHRQQGRFGRPGLAGRGAGQHRGAQPRRGGAHGPLRPDPRGPVHRRQARRRRRGRPDAHPRRHDLWRRRRGGSALRRGRAGRPGARRRGLHQGRPAALPGPGAAGAGHGLRRDADAGAQGDAASAWTPTSCWWPRPSTWGACWSWTSRSRGCATSWPRSAAGRFARSCRVR